MADNVAITPGAGKIVLADEVTDATLGTGVVQLVKLMDGTIDGTAKAAVGVNGLAVDVKAVAGTVIADTELTTKDFDSGAGTDTVAVSGLVVPASGGSVAVTGDTANGLDVDVTRLPALVAGSAVIGHVIVDTAPSTAVTNVGTFATQATLAAETTKVIGTVNVASAQTVGIVAGSAVIGKVGVDQTTIGTTNAVTVNKRTGTTNLAPQYYSVRLAAKATTTVTASTAYLECVVITTSNAGTAMSITLQDKQGTPIIMYTITTAVVGTVTIPFSQPVVMTSGMDIVIGGTTAGVVNIFLTYWQ